MRLQFLMPLLLLGQIMVGQQLQFENLGQKLPLPSQETYNIMQDGKGYIWFSTEQGFCKYDGNKVTVFDRKNGLPEGAIYSVAEDKSGRLWLATSKNRILIYENGKLSEAPFSKTLVKQSNKFAIICALHLRQNKLYINLVNQTFIADTKTGKLTEMPRKTDIDFWFLKDGNQFISYAAWHNASFKMMEAAREKPIRIHIEGAQKKIVTVPRGDILVVNAKHAKSNAGHYGAFSISDKLIKCESGIYTYHQMPMRILSIHIDKDGGLWVGMAKGGLYYFPKGDFSQTPIVNLKGYSVSGVLEDAEKNIWCTTLEKGLFFCKNKNVVNYFNIPKLAQVSDILKTIDDAVYCSYGAQITKIKNREVEHFPIRSYTKEGILDIVKYQNEFYITGFEITARTNDKFEPEHIFRISDTNSYTGGPQLQQSDGQLYLIFPGAFAEIKNGFVHQLLQMYTRSRCFTPQGNGRFLVGCNDGLYQVAVDTKSAVKIPGIIHPITQILAFGKDFWMTTKGGGLYRYDGKKIVSVNSKFAIPTLLLFDIAAYKNDLWIGSNVGLIKVSPTQTNAKCEIYTTANGLPGNEVYKFALCGDQIFVSTVEGVCSYAPDVALKNTEAPKVYLNSVFVNGNKIKSTDKLQLGYHQNALRFTFDKLSFKAQSQLYFQLKGRSETFRTVQTNEIVVENIDPGSYELIVYAVNNDGFKSQKPVIIAFEIEKPFWQTIWFLLACLIVLGLVVFVVVRKIVARIKIRETEKTRINKLIADSQLTALQAQMNPHFIFNSINSIQNYILNQKETEAYDYLAKFSKLVRLVLHNSQEQMLSLHDEIETVKLYVELEQMRFSDSFDFAVEIDGSIDAYEVMIPTMIIQPYLENAIWHGLMNLDGQRRGEIVLSISETNNMLQMQIRDNGIGRQLSQQYRNQNTHKPVAMKLTEQRLKIVNEFYKDKLVRVEISDLYDADGKASGTQVMIYLPILNFE